MKRRFEGETSNSWIRTHWFRTEWKRRKFPNLFPSRLTIITPLLSRVFTSTNNFRLTFKRTWIEFFRSNQVELRIARNDRLRLTGVARSNRSLRKEYITNLDESSARAANQWRGHHPRRPTSTSLIVRSPLKRLFVPQRSQHRGQATFKVSIYIAYTSPFSTYLQQRKDRLVQE